MADDDADLWQDIEHLAQRIDERGLQGCRDKIEHFLQHTHSPDPGSHSLKDFRQYAVLHLLRSIFGKSPSPRPRLRVVPKGGTILDAG
jgi:hypothetical protein